jgi:uncharacterized membrane protein
MAAPAFHPTLYEEAIALAIFIVLGLQLPKPYGAVIGVLLIGGYLVVNPAQTTTLEGQINSYINNINPGGK